MDLKIKKVEIEEKHILFNLMQFALYDSTFYIDNKMNKEGVFEYKWLDNYFTDEDRAAYLIQDECDNILGMAMVNGYLKVPHNCKAQSIAEFLVLPKYRKQHIGKKVAHAVFNMYDGEWEVQPMENNQGAYMFWEKTIVDYSNNNYIKHKLEDGEDIFVFSSNKT